VVCVTEAVVYVAQNVAASADDTVKTEAHASVSGLSHAITKGEIVARKRNERIMTSITI